MQSPTTCVVSIRADCPTNDSIGPCVESHPDNDGKTTCPIDVVSFNDCASKCI